MDKIMIAEFVGSFGDTMSDVAKNTIVASIIHWEQYKAAAPPPEGNTPTSEVDWQHAFNGIRRQLQNAEVDLKHHDGKDGINYKTFKGLNEKYLKELEEYLSQSPPSLQEREKDDVLWEEVYIESAENKYYSGPDDPFEKWSFLGWMKSKFNLIYKPTNESEDTAKQSK